MPLPVPHRQYHEYHRMTLRNKDLSLNYYVVNKYIVILSKCIVGFPLHFPACLACSLDRASTSSHGLYRRPPMPTLGAGTGGSLAIGTPSDAEVVLIPAAILSPAFHRGWVSLPLPPILHRFLTSPDAWGN